MLPNKVPLTEEQLNDQAWAEYYNAKSCQTVHNNITNLIGNNQQRPVKANGFLFALW
jgi:hypothetical protein